MSSHADHTPWRQVGCDQRPQLPTSDTRQDSHPEGRIGREIIIGLRKELNLLALVTIVMYHVR